MLFFTSVSQFMDLKGVFFFSFKLSACIKTLCSALTSMAVPLDIFTVSAQQTLLHLLVPSDHSWDLVKLRSFCYHCLR